MAGRSLRSKGLPVQEDSDSENTSEVKGVGIEGQVE
jgi:hypothetical protein